MNPINILDSILADYASPKVRRLVHSVLLLGLVIAIAVLSFDGDWLAALTASAAAVYAALNRANTPAAPLDQPEPDDGSSYEEAGGQPFPEDLA